MDLGILINNDLVKLGRTADMLWLAVGNLRTIKIPYANGIIKKKEVRDYAIHFQCQWRFVQEGKILLASHDIYNPFDTNLEYDEDWIWDIFDREKEQSSVFDVHSKNFMDEFFPLKIKEIYYTNTHDLHIDFENNIYFDTFISTSTKCEFYRFIDFCTSEETKHTVIFDEPECNQF